MEDMLTKAISTFGNVEELVTDGGPPYNSREFKKFARRQGFKHRIYVVRRTQKLMDLWKSSTKSW